MTTTLERPRAVNGREDKARRLIAAGMVHEPVFALTRIVEGETGGPYFTTALLCPTGHWTGSCTCRDGVRRAQRNQPARLDNGEGCGHLRATYAEATIIYDETESRS